MILTELIDYINEQKDIEKSINPYISGYNYDFAIELVEGFMVELDESEAEDY